MKIITNAKLIVGEKILIGYSLIFDKKIISITKKEYKEIESIDAKGAYLSAGFIDIHIHGSGGADIMDSTPQSLNRLSKTILQTGTTSFLATTMTMPKEDIKNALYNIKKHKDEVEGAKILGVHLEGPFINIKKSGAQNPKYIQKPNFNLIADYIDIIKLITIAPEIEGAKEFIQSIHKNHPDIIFGIGHSTASYYETKSSFRWGVSHATHLFNAMNPLHHREVGVVGAVLEDDNISCEIIADNIHIDPVLYDIVYKLKGEQLLLITDAMRAGCMRCGEYSLGGQKVIVTEKEARLESGALAGSILRLNEALKNFYNHSKIELPQLIAMVTSIPAKKLGLKIGELKEGYSADIVIFDKEFNIIKTFVEGELKHG
jgi:N-acetylglucosamine-6-phosphate deacetylase